MRFAVFGAGAVGGFLGARLIEAGEDVSLIARGRHLEAIRTRGLRVRSDDYGDRLYHPPATAEPGEIGSVDAVLFAVKAQAAGEAARQLSPLLGPGTCIVTMQNGIPWWYFHGTEGRWAGTSLASVDPGGVTARDIELRRVVGCIVYCSCVLSEPGVIDHVRGNGFALGEPDGSKTERLDRLASCFSKAALKAPVRPDLRHEIWVKILGNATFNPVTALTEATLAEMIDFPPTRELALCMMEEVRAVASSLGVDIRITNEKRLDGARRVGDHKTSMLQDFEAGRSTELDPILGAVIELAEKTEVPVPHLRAVYACAKLAFSRGSARH